MNLFLWLAIGFLFPFTRESGRTRLIWQTLPAGIVGALVGGWLIILSSVESLLIEFAGALVGAALLVNLMEAQFSAIGGPALGGSSIPSAKKPSSSPPEPKAKK